MLILEGSSSVSPKLEAFISHLPDEDKKKIKEILNGVYLFLKGKGFTYEEVSKPQKGPYFGSLTKIGGAKDLDQLVWKLKVSVPLSYDKQAVYKLSLDIKDELKSLARKINGSYFYDSTNKDFYDAVGFNSNKSVEVGKHSDGSGVFYDHANNLVKVVYVIKVVVPRAVEDKTKIDTSDNHKYIEGKIKSFVEPQAMRSVNNALDTIYDYVNKTYKGCIESKRVMNKDAEIFVKDNSYNGRNHHDNYKALIWKTELKDTSAGYLHEDKLVKTYTKDDVEYVNVDDRRYVIGKVNDDYYVGIAEDYGSRDIRYLYFIILKRDINQEGPVISNKFMSSDGKNLKNTHVSVSYDKGRKVISGSDLEDMANMPRFYTTKKKGIEAAWDRLVSEFNENTTDSDCMRIIGYGMTHMYYAMD